VVNTADGEVVSAGVNLVLSSGLSAAHAEVVALSLAQLRVGTWDLGAQDAADRELVVNWRPCAQCYGATMWSGVRRLVRFFTVVLAAIAVTMFLKAAGVLA